MDFTVWKDVCIGSLCAVFVSGFILWLCRRFEAKQKLERVVEPAQDGDTMRDASLEPKHKVFLSHSGAQKNFVEQLCVDIERHDRYPFFDRRLSSLPIGRDFPKLIFEAIEQCKVGVVILSEEFFTLSKWPMLELVAMTKNAKLVIIPVFLGMSLEQYRDPRRQKRWVSIWRGWARQEKKHGRKIDIEEWRGALRALVPLNSLIYDGGSEVIFREKIVRAVCDVVLPETRWKDSHVHGRSRLTKLMCGRIDEAQVSQKYGIPIVGLYGVGGIGKTTMCQTLCNEYFRRMQGRVFHVELGGGSDIELLQGTLKSLTDKSHEFVCGLNKSQCEDLLRREMQKQAVFLAIDNMSDNTKFIEQAKCFLAAGFSKGSIVVVTARSLEALKLGFLDINDKNCLEMPELLEDEAKSLFMEHGMSSGAVGLEMNNEIIASCLKRCYFRKGDGKGFHYHPLAVKVLGTQLGYIKYDQRKWATTLEEMDTFNRLRAEEHPIFSILRKSFDILKLEDQMLFMDVALYLPEQSWKVKVDMTWFDWLSMVHGTSVDDIMDRLEGLKRKSLLQDLGDGWSTRIGMHDLWYEFAAMESKVGKFEGRRWVYEVGLLGALEEGTPPGGCWQNIKRMCFLREGLLSVESINLDHFCNITVMKMGRDLWARQFGKLRVDMQKLKHLKSLELYGVDVEAVGLGSVKSLCYLNLSSVTLSEAIVDAIGDLTNLRVLVLEIFEGKRVPEVNKLIWLEEVYFCDCDGVATISGFNSRLSKLRVLNLSGCSSLWSLGFGVEDLIALREFHLGGCDKLEELPNLQKFSSLRVLDIQSCTRLILVPGLDNLVALEELDASGCEGIVELPNLQKLTSLRVLRVQSCSRLESLPGLGNLVALEKLDTSRCAGIVELPNLQKLTSLRVLRVQSCSRLESLPGLDNLVALEKLDASRCAGIVELPNLQKLTSLRVLNVQSCTRLKSVPSLDNLVALEELDVSGCEGIVELSNLEKLTSLRVLNIQICSRLELVPGLDNLVALEKLLALGCKGIVELPNLQKLTSLRVLSVRSCSRLKSLPSLDNLVALEELDASRCEGIVELPNLQKLTSPRVLRVRSCSRLKSLLGLDNLVALEELDAFGCEGIVELPNLQKLTSLRVLNVRSCSRLKSLPGLDNLVALEELDAFECEGIVELSNLEKLTSLRVLNVRSCSRLESLPGLDNLVALEELDASGCKGIVELPNLQKLTSLRVLNIQYCSRLKSLPGLDNLVALEKLDASGCEGIVELSNLEKLTSLQKLDIAYCKGLKSLPGLDNLVALEELDAFGCKGIVELPNLQKLTRLRTLDIFGRPKIRSLRGFRELVALQQLRAMGCSALVKMPHA